MELRELTLFQKRINHFQKYLKLTLKSYFSQIIFLWKQKNCMLLHKLRKKVHLIIQKLTYQHLLFLQMSQKNSEISRNARTLPNTSEQFRTVPNTSERFRTHPDASERIRVYPSASEQVSRSEQVRKPRKTKEKL